jgi:ABC-type Fe3+ transport system permease subunit
MSNSAVWRGRAFGTSLGLAVAAGALVAVIAIALAASWQHTRRDAGTEHPVLFPSPGGT